MTRALSALIIGNSKYAHAGALRNPSNDAQDVSSRLQACGFSVAKVIDASHAEMDRALKSFRSALADQQVGLFFFAGHGVQIDGENYLAAVDTDVSDEITTKHSSLPLNRVIETMEKAGPTTSIIVLDACRDNPWERAWHRSATTRGLASVYAPKGTLIAFATSPGQVASDGAGRNGAYTSALLKHLDTPDCSIESMFKRVRNTLSVSTSGKQISWEHTSLAGEFYFNLSIGARITDYSPNALSDKLFVLDDAREAHQIIKELKVLTWHRQNPAVAQLVAADANKFDDDSLFVIGRNLYQSAAGSANASNDYIMHFMDRTTALAAEKRKAILDGMLFEVFFDSRGQFRESYSRILVTR